MRSSTATSTYPEKLILCATRKIPLRHLRRCRCARYPCKSMLPTHCLCEMSDSLACTVCHLRIRWRAGKPVRLNLPNLPRFPNHSHSSRSKGHRWWPLQTYVKAAGEQRISLRTTCSKSGAVVQWPLPTISHRWNILHIGRDA